MTSFEEQVRAYVAKGYPDLLGVAEDDFRAGLDPLRPLVPGPGAGGEADGLDFVLVLPGVPVETALERVEVGGRAGFVPVDAADLPAYGPVAGVVVPAGPYLLVDVERGDAYANWSPDEALPAIAARGRTPLTIAEGVALLTVAPRLLEKNRCFMTLASRGRDKRVPALWISGGTGKDGRERRGAPKLGWCWAGNRHTWLGHASAAARLTDPASSVGVPTMAASRSREELR